MIATNPFVAKRELPTVPLAKLLTHFVCARDAIEQLTFDQRFLFRRQQLGELDPFRNCGFALAGCCGLRFFFQHQNTPEIRIDFGQLRFGCRSRGRARFARSLNRLNRGL